MHGDGGKGKPLQVFFEAVVVVGGSCCRGCCGPNPQCSSLPFSPLAYSPTFDLGQRVKKEEGETRGIGFTKPNNITLSTRNTAWHQSLRNCKVDFAMSRIVTMANLSPPILPAAPLSSILPFHFYGLPPSPPIRLAGETREGRRPLDWKDEGMT